MLTLLACPLNERYMVNERIKNIEQGDLPGLEKWCWR